MARNHNYDNESITMLKGRIRSESVHQLFLADGIGAVLIQSLRLYQTQLMRQGLGLVTKLL